MTMTKAQRTAAARRGPSIRVSVADLMKSKVSMLREEMLPAGYSELETDYDIRDHVFGSKPDERVVRMQIVWDLPADALEEVEDVLDRMRERGAAMIVTAEEVKR